MAHEYKLSTAATAKEIDKAFASAVKALSILGIKMPMKKPDAAKLQAAMEPAGKKAMKAEFKLTANKNLLTMVVDVGGSATQLGEFDTDKAKDLEEKKAVVQNMVEAGLMDRSALDQFNDGPDPKVVANQLSKVSKEIVVVTKDVATAQDLLNKLENERGFWRNLTCKRLRSAPEKWKEFEAYATKADATESILFFKAVAKGMPNQKLIEIFVRDGAQYQINLPAPLRMAIEAGKAPASNGVGEIESMLEVDVLRRFCEIKATPYTAPIAAVARKLAALQARLSSLQDEKKKLAG